MPKNIFLVAVGVLVGFVLGAAQNVETVSAQAIESWSKSSVTPILFVKPSFGGFVPADGNSIGVTWSKEQVLPVVLVKPSLGGFVPVDGISIGNTWSKNEVRPVVFVEPSLGMFVAANSTPSDAQPTVSAPRPQRSVSPRPTKCDPAIETQINGDFNGWEGETVYKMDDGSIWQQSNYHYHYHYAYRPSVIIFSGTSGVCHIKVQGDDDDGVDVVKIN